MNAPTTPVTTTQSVASRFLDALKAQGVRYLFGNAGTDFPPLIEAIAKARHEGRETIEPVLVPHENVAMGMAYGAHLATGKAQVVMVHVGLGTANALCGLFNATRQHIPLILAAGRTPVLEKGRLGARNNYINWAQEMFDQSAMLRELVKWDYELRLPEQVEEVVARAFSVAQSNPPGPAYVVLPREVLADCSPQPAALPAVPMMPASPGRAAQHDIERLSRWLGEAQRPVIITADMGRTSEGFHALTAFAEGLAIPVVQYRPRFLSLSCNSPVNGGWDPNPWLKEADLIIVAECDVPWMPEQVVLGPQTRVVHIGKDPLYAGYPMRGFRSDMSLQVDAAETLRELTALLAPSADSATIEHRSRWIASKHAAKGSAASADTLNNRYVSRCISEAMDSKTVLFNEYPFSLEELALERPESYFSHSSAGGLGWATGACLGYRLERPDALCIATVGDGVYMFSNPTPLHFVSRARNLPFITVIYNNHRWAAVHRATLSMYPDGHAAADAEPVLSTLAPSPEYERIVEASGGLGIRVERPQDLPEALERAKHAVRVEGRQAVLNVITEVNYSRTS